MGTQSKGVFMELNRSIMIFLLGIIWIAPKFFGAGDDAFTASARTYGELQKVLDDETLTDGQGLRMVEIFMERLDAPEGPLLDLLRRQGPVAEQGKAMPCRKFRRSRVRASWKRSIASKLFEGCWY